MGRIIFLVFVFFGSGSESRPVNHLFEFKPFSDEGDYLKPQYEFQTTSPRPTRKTSTTLPKNWREKYKMNVNDTEVYHPNSHVHERLENGWYYDTRRFPQYHVKRFPRLFRPLIQHRVPRPPFYPAALLQHHHVSWDNKNFDRILTMMAPRASGNYYSNQFERRVDDPKTEQSGFGEVLEKKPLRKNDPSYRSEIDPLDLYGWNDVFNGPNKRKNLYKDDCFELPFKCPEQNPDHKFIAANYHRGFRYGRLFDRNRQEKYNHQYYKPRPKNVKQGKDDSWEDPEILWEPESSSER